MPPFDAGHVASWGEIRILCVQDKWDSRVKKNCTGDVTTPGLTVKHERTCTRARRNWTVMHDDTRSRTMVQRNVREIDKVFRR